jgi:hypothetical protein
MTQSNFGSPTQYETTKIEIDGEDIVGVFFSISIFEDVYRPCVTGNIILQDTVTSNEGESFIEKQNFEFIEPIEVEFKNANGNTLSFKGVLNGLRNEYVKNSIKYYTIDFTSESVRENEKKFVVKSFKDIAPEAIVSEMIELVGGSLDSNATGKNMQYLGSRKRPLDIVKYVCTHGLSQDTEATENEDELEEEAKGSTGFLCWETCQGYNFETIDDVLSGKVGTEHKDYKTVLANRGAGMTELMKNIVRVEFNQIGDFQTKLRSGAFGGKNISFDMDSGVYKEYTFYNENSMTEKQKEAFPEGSISRYFSKPIDNQKFSQECEKAQPLTGDQSRAYLNQNAGRQNTFSDQTGYFTLYPTFSMKAGDSFECQINKPKDEKGGGGPDKKHSGRYAIQAVGHHLFQDGKAYTKIKTIRSTIQQDESSSTQT